MAVLEQNYRGATQKCQIAIPRRQEYCEAPKNAAYRNTAALENAAGGQEKRQIVTAGGCSRRGDPRLATRARGFHKPGAPRIVSEARNPRNEQKLLTKYLYFPHITPSIHLIPRISRNRVRLGYPFSSYARKSHMLPE